MNYKNLCGMLFSLLCGCSSANQEKYASFDDYPVPEGSWEEMSYSPFATSFSAWAPTAEEVRVLLYEQGEGGAPYEMIQMKRAEDGLWEASMKSDLKGKFYTFNVKIDGRWQGDTPGIKAKAVGVNGNRAAIIDFKDTNPQGWEKDVRPQFAQMSDAIIYEMHFRDISIDTVSGIKNRGKFIAFSEENTHTFWGEKTGLDHLKELGITHVHILPSFDFSSIDESKLDVPQYNWGYDPKNYNVPEGSYSTNPFDPVTRIREFKQMVMAFHKAGIRVVMDVVYNHTASTTDGNFERMVPGYFYRQDKDGNLANASGCGNETASERAMMRKYMIESVCYWASEYHIDGFRFDLMGVHDIQTMNDIRLALDKIDPTIIMYGEGWAAAAPQLPFDELAMKNNVYKMPGVAAFSDEFRDSLRGPFGQDDMGAFLLGRKGHENGIRFGIVGGVKHPQLKKDSVNAGPDSWVSSPSQFISYVSCHDDLCLADRLKKTLSNASEAELVALQKLAETAVLTSQGVPFIFSGDEFMRTKYGNPNTYNMSDSINAINWYYKTKYRDVFDYVKGLVEIRKAHPAFRMGKTELVCEYLEFLPAPSSVVAFLIKGAPCNDTWSNIIVVLNAQKSPVVIQIPEGEYRVACKDGIVDTKSGIGVISGNQVKVSPRSALIIHQ